MILILYLTNMSCIKQKPPEEVKGLHPLEWNRIVDGYNKTHKMTVDDYEALDPYQLFYIQTQKRHFARLKKPVINKVHHSLKTK